MQYIAKAGDTWDLIAFNFYGNEMKSTDIMEVNPRLTDIVIFEGGEVLNLPENVETADNSTLAPWRR
jgi:nucleoid-associated protein YgaU